MSNLFNVQDSDEFELCVKAEGVQDMFNATNPELTVDQRLQAVNCMMQFEIMLSLKESMGTTIPNRAA